MVLLLKLALKNLIRAGLRTWLNVFVLSFSFVLIIWTQGIYHGIYEQAKSSLIQEEVSGGQYWSKGYNPDDLMSVDDSHKHIFSQVSTNIKQGKAVPILIRQASIYPHGRMRNVILKGINPHQTLLKFPSIELSRKKVELPVLIGAQMAKSMGMKMGDSLIIRFRNANGALDAVEGTIVAIMKTQSPNIDRGQLWVPLEKLQEITMLPDEATIIVVQGALDFSNIDSGWKFKQLTYFLRDVQAFINQEMIGARILYALLMFLALLGIFDTQVLSIFKRRKEIGTLMALGMSKNNIIGLFTIEGALHGLLAGILAMFYGGPIIIWTSIKGFPIPKFSQNTLSFGIPERIFPSYDMPLILVTIIIIMVAVTLVSFQPSFKISKLKPSDAIRGKTK